MIEHNNNYINVIKEYIVGAVKTEKNKAEAPPNIMRAKVDDHTTSLGTECETSLNSCQFR